MKFLITALAMILLVPFTASASDIDSPAAPDSPDSAMYTVEDIYQYLLNGRTSLSFKRGSGFQGPSSGPGSTTHNLDDIMGVTPPYYPTHGATTDQVLDGQYFFGLTDGQWGPQVGTMVDPYATVDPLHGVTAYISTIDTPGAGNSPTTGGWDITMTGDFTADTEVVDCDNLFLSVGGIEINCLDDVDLTLVSSSIIVFKAPATTGIAAISMKIALNPISLIIPSVAANGQISYINDPSPGITYDPPSITSVAGCTDDFPNTYDCSVTGQPQITITGSNFGTDVVTVSVADNQGNPLTCTSPAITIDEVEITCTLPMYPVGERDTELTVTVDGQSDTFPINYGGPGLYPGTIREIAVGDLGVATCFGTAGPSVSLDDNTAVRYIEMRGDGFGVDPENIDLRLGLPNTDFDDMPFSIPTIPTPAEDPPIAFVLDPPGACGSLPNKQILQVTVPAGFQGKNLVFGVGVDGFFSFGTDTITFPAPIIIDTTLRNTELGAGKTFYDSPSNLGEWVYFDVDYLGNRNDLVSVNFGPSGGPYTKECAHVSYPTPGTIKCITVPGTGTDLVFQVEGFNQLSAEGTDLYSYPVAPAVTSVKGCTDVDPNTTDCPTAGGRMVTITGSGFGTSENDLQIMVGSDLVTNIRSCIDTSIKFILEPGTGSQPLSLRVGNTMDVGNSKLISYKTPTITSVSGCTDQGITTIGCSQAGGTTITLSGSELGPDGGLVFVKGVYAGTLTHTPGNLYNEGTFQLPAGDGWNVPVQFINSAGDVSNIILLSYID